MYFVKCTLPTFGIQQNKSVITTLIFMNVEFVVSFDDLDVTN